MSLKKIPDILSSKLNSLSEKLEFRKCDPKVFIYRDCFETVRSLLEFIRPEYLCDIGANAGNWSYVMHQLNPELKQVVFFEPQKKYYERLKALSLGDAKKIIYNCGLGNKEELLLIKGGTASASLFEVNNNQDHYFPNTVRNESEKVEIKVLDQIYLDDSLHFPDVIKLDVQGYELNVLKGATNILSKAKFLVIELSFQEFYVGQPPLWKILQFLDENHYVMVGHGYEWRSDKKPMELLQMDGIFVNTKIIDYHGNNHK